MSTPILFAHREHLLEALAAELTHASGDSAGLPCGRLLDVGCGEGYLLSLLSEQGLEAEGLERNPRRVARATEKGRKVREGQASELPYPDDAFDTVLIRHVLHHLDDPGRAVAEACRVARSQLILAEPSTDSSVPSQLGMARLDAFLSLLAARGGHVHHPFLTAGALIALVPGEPKQIDLRVYSRLTRASTHEVRAMIDEDAHGQELGPDDLREREALLQEAEQGRISYNGSLTVFLSL